MRVPRTVGGDWLVGAAPLLTYRALLVAVKLLRRVVDPNLDFGGRSRSAVLTAQLANVLFRIGRDAEAEVCARRALPLLTDPDLAAQTRWVLAYVPYRASRAEEALAILDDVLADPRRRRCGEPGSCRWVALVQRAGIGEVERSANSARDAVRLGEAARDAFAIGFVRSQTFRARPDLDMLFIAVDVESNVIMTRVSRSPRHN